MKSKEKVLMISSDFPPIPGGQSRFLYDLWSCLPGEKVVVLVPEVEGAEAVDADLDCRIMRISLPLGGGRWGRVRKAFGLLWAALRVVREEEVRAVHCGQVFSAGFAGYGCRLLEGVPYYPYVHGADLLEFRDQFLWGRLLRRILGRAEKVIVNSRFTGRAVQACGVDPERIELIHPAIDLERFSGRVDRDQVRREKGWEGKKVILSRVVEPELIAGLVIHVAGRLIDGSVASHLDTIRERLQQARVVEVA